MAKYKPFYHAESGITFKDFQQVREWIWNNREHVSEISGAPLLYPSHPQFHFQFLHVLNRYHTHWVLNPANVLLGTVFEHDHQDTFPIFTEKKQELTRLYYQRYYGKQF